ncbi:DUF5671 domain-containing protein [Nocardioides bigeumensis]|uniref:DUF5671 domain-containing protein n=1 Tax=Nocardioides bigeumensis TaxID=433657 RepID=A0ABN2Y3W8_9ACTN
MTRGRGRVTRPPTSPGPATAGSVRRFFQYGGLLVLDVVSAVGLSGLLAAALDTIAGRGVAREVLARNLVWLTVGLPLLVLVVRWARRSQQDPTEGTSLARSLYLSAACLVSLGVVALSLHDLLAWVLGQRAPAVSSAATLLVWGSFWGVHERIVARSADTRAFRPLLVLGSIAGLVLGGLGFGVVLAGALERWFGLPSDVLLAGRHDEVRAGLATLVVGVLVWWWYWIRQLRDAERDDLWHAYVVLVAMAGSLLTLLSAGTLAAYRMAAWLLGRPGTSDADSYFATMPELVAAAVTGALVLGYHRQVLRARVPSKRSEVDRVRDYVMAGIALATAAAGACVLVAAAAEGLTGKRTPSHTAVDTALAGVVLLAAGAPLWAFHWRSARRAAKSDPQDEVASVTRRAYLFLVLGLSSLAAVAALLAGGFVVVSDILAGRVGAATLDGSRYPLGILCAAGAAAAGHWVVYQHDRTVAGSRRGPRFVLLLGVGDPAMARSLAHRWRCTVLFWTLPDQRPQPRSENDVLALVEGSGALEQVVVQADDGALRSLRVERSAPPPFGA